VARRITVCKKKRERERETGTNYAQHSILKTLNILLHSQNLYDEAYLYRLLDFYLTNIRTPHLISKQISVKTQ
jgi:hypothetical protein